MRGMSTARPKRRPRTGAAVPPRRHSPHPPLMVLPAPIARGPSAPVRDWWRRVALGQGYTCPRRFAGDAAVGVAFYGTFAALVAAFFGVL